jgi:hypothetical protein
MEILFCHMIKRPNRLPDICSYDLLREMWITPEQPLCKDEHMLDKFWGDEHLSKFKRLDVFVQDMLSEGGMERYRFTGRAPSPVHYQMYRGTIDGVGVTVCIPMYHHVQYGHILKGKVPISFDFYVDEDRNAEKVKSDIRDWMKGQLALE